MLFYAAASHSYVRYGAESRTFYALSAIAFLYTLACTPLLLGGAGPALGATYQALALVLAVIAARLGKRSLSFQAYVMTFLALLVLAATAVSLAPPGKDAAAGGAAVWLLATGAGTVAVFVRLRSFRRPGEAFSLQRLSVRSTALVLVLAAGVFELFAGTLPFAYSLACRIVPHQTGEREALWLTVQTLLFITGALGILAVGIRLRLAGATFLGVVFMAGGGLKLLLLDAIRVPATYLVCSAAVFGLSLIASSVLHRRSRGKRAES